MANHTIDARIHVRVSPHPNQPVLLQIVGNGFIEMMKARDISIGGVGVLVPHDFDGCDIKSEVQIVVTLPNLRPFLARGMIRHRAVKSAEEHLFGIEFTWMSKEDSARLQEYILRRKGEGGVSLKAAY